MAKMMANTFEPVSNVHAQSKVLFIRMTPTLHQRVMDRASQNNMSASELSRQMIEYVLAEMERDSPIRLADDRCENA